MTFTAKVREMPTHLLTYSPVTAEVGLGQSVSNRIYNSLFRTEKTLPTQYMTFITTDAKALQENENKCTYAFHLSLRILFVFTIYSYYSIMQLFMILFQQAFNISVYNFHIAFCDILKLSKIWCIGLLENHNSSM